MRAVLIMHALLQISFLHVAKSDHLRMWTGALHAPSCLRKWDFRHAGRAIARKN